MIFGETDYIDLTNIPTVFIYFLLQNDEVVYVGQTQRGLARVYSHIRDKKFNKIYIIECAVEELDYMENRYILKYKPIYNKVPNMKSYYSLNKVVHSLNLEYSKYSKGVFDYKFTRPKLKKMIEVLSIVPIEYNNKLYISIEDYYEIMGCIDDYMKGAPVNEIFNIGIQSSKNN